MDSPWTWQVLRAGAFRLDGGSMFGVVPRVLWQKLAPPDDRNRIDLQTNCVLLRRDEQLVLIETGYGGKWSDKERDIFHLENRTIIDALREVSVEPEDLRHVIVSHLHFDHAGGLTHFDDAGRAVRSFPNARIHVQQREWDDARANKSTMTKTYLRSHLDPIADQVHAIDGSAEVLPGLRVEPAPGHTWGQQMVLFDDAEGTLCFPGDVMPTANHAGLAFSMGYDMEPYTNMRTKQGLLERAAKERWRLVLDHDPHAPLQCVERDDEKDAHRLVAIDVES